MQVISAGGANEIASAARTTCCCAAADAAAAVDDRSEYVLKVNDGHVTDGFRKTRTPHCDTLAHGEATPAARASASFPFA